MDNKTKQYDIINVQSEINTEKHETQSIEEKPIEKQVENQENESQLSPEELERLADDIIRQLKSVYDPEIPVDIYELGLIYKVDVSDDRDVTIDMTLTAPGCPVAGEMPIWVKQAVEQVAGIRMVKVNMVFDPPWTIERMSEEARLELNMF